MIQSRDALGVAVTASGAGVSLGAVGGARRLFGHAGYVIVFQRLALGSTAGRAGLGSGTGGGGPGVIQSRDALGVAVTTGRASVHLCAVGGASRLFGHAGYVIVIQRLPLGGTTGGAGLWNGAGGVRPRVIQRRENHTAIKAIAILGTGGFSSVDMLAGNVGINGDIR